MIQTLCGQYDLSCFFCNPNIAPETEYQLRLTEAKKTADYFKVPFSTDDYLPESWESAIAGAEDTAEGGERCRRCFMLRLRRTAAFCRSENIPAFTTVMSVSPHKNIKMLNECGALAAAEAGVLYEPFDFKKKDGFKKSIILSKELGLYRQDYCGCRLSREESRERKPHVPSISVFLRLTIFLLTFFLAHRCGSMYFGALFFGA